MCDREAREEFMAEKIKEVRPDMHVGGLSHVYDFKETEGFRILWERAHQPGDIRIKLCEADNLPQKLLKTLK